jgi:hypothetical protein
MKLIVPVNTRAIPAKACDTQAATMLPVRCNTYPQISPNPKVVRIPVSEVIGNVDVAVLSKGGKKCHRVKQMAVTTHPDYFPIAS